MCWISGRLRKRWSKWDRMIYKRVLLNRVRIVCRRLGIRVLWIKMALFWDLRRTPRVSLYLSWYLSTNVKYLIKICHTSKSWNRLSIVSSSTCFKSAFSFPSFIQRLQNLQMCLKSRHLATVMEFRISICTRTLWRPESEFTKYSSNGDNTCSTCQKIRAHKFLSMSMIRAWVERCRRNFLQKFSSKNNRREIRRRKCSEIWIWVQSGYLNRMALNSKRLLWVMDRRIRGQRKYRRRRRKEVWTFLIETNILYNISRVRCQ